LSSIFFIFFIVYKTSIEAPPHSF